MALFRDVCPENQTSIEKTIIEIRYSLHRLAVQYQMSWVEGCTLILQTNSCVDSFVAKTFDMKYFVYNIPHL